MDGAGTISGRWALAAGRAAIEGCRICHGPTLPGTRLCTQCKAALKRARQETVSELVPPLKRSAPRAGTRQRAPRATVAAPERARISPLALRGTALVLLLFAAVAVAFGALRFAQPAASLPDAQEAQAVPSATPSPSPREAPPPSRTDLVLGPSQSAAPPSATKAGPPRRPGAPRRPRRRRDRRHRANPSKLHRPQPLARSRSSRWPLNRLRRNRRSRPRQSRLRHRSRTAGS